MKPGPRIGAGANADQRSFVEKANDAWDGAAPDWVLELAEYTDSHRLKGAAEKLACSVALVSTTIGNKYQGDLQRVEEMVRGAIMGAVVDCPIKGEMTRDVCLGWQRKPYALTSSARIEMYRACRGGCPHSKLKKGDEDAA